MSARLFRRAGAVGTAAVVLAALTACSNGPQPFVPHDTGASGGSAPGSTPPTSASTTTTTTPATTPATTGASDPPTAIVTTDSATGALFVLPTDISGPTTGMVQTYIAWETGYRRSMATATLDPSVSQLGAGQALSVVTTTVSYLQTHHGTLVGPWRFTVSEAKASGRVGVLRLCIAGGSQIFDGTKSGFTKASSETVTLNNGQGLGWRVTGYDDTKQACA